MGDRPINYDFDYGASPGGDWPPIVGGVVDEYPANPVHQHWAGIGFVVTRNATNSHTSTSNWQTVAFNTKEWDPEKMFSLSTNSITIPDQFKGIWHIEARIEFAGFASGSGRIELRFNKNSDEAYLDWEQLEHGTTAQGLAINTITEFAAGDTILVEAWQNSGGSLQYNGTDSSLRRFAAHWLGDPGATFLR